MQATWWTTSTAVSRVRVGERCELAQRVGTVSVEDSFGYVYLYTSLYDRPDPLVGDPVYVSGGCAFHEASTVSCTCATGFICGHDGTCVEPRLPLRHTLTVSLVCGSQVLDGASDTSWGAATVGGSGDAFTLQLQVGTVAVDLPSTVGVNQVPRKGACASCQLSSAQPADERLAPTVAS